MGATATKPVSQSRPEARGGLLRLDAMDANALRDLLSRTRQFASEAANTRSDTLSGRFVANLFFEDSTRTRISFEVAARWLGADMLTLNGATSATNKGETLADTGRVLESLGASVLVIRCNEAGGTELVANAVGIPVINAGDGAHEHPTQGLLDIYTICEAHDRLESFDLSGLTVAIVGDILHSRVARSDVFGITTLGARVICVGPPALCPDEIRHLGCEISHDLDEVLPQVDAVQMLRMQFERGANVDSLARYQESFQVNEQRAGALKAGAIVMHPGPMNRGVEITNAVADGPRSRIFRQDAVGVFVRMAVLASCITVHEESSS